MSTPSSTPECEKQLKFDHSLDYTNYGTTNEFKLNGSNGCEKSKKNHLIQECIDHQFVPDCIIECVEEEIEKHYLEEDTKLGNESNLSQSNNVGPATYTYFFLIAIFAGLTDVILCMWNLFVDDVSGIYIILLFLNVFFVYGQGIISFLFFFEFKNTKEHLISLLSAKKKSRLRSHYLEI